jgi:hypothetical protein
MSWDEARAALAGHLDGLTWTTAGHSQETLRCLEHPPASTPTTYPYGYCVPAERVYSTAPSMQILTISPRVRVVLTGSATHGADVLARRFESAINALVERMVGFRQMGGSADTFVEQQFSGLQSWPEDSDGWGFVMTLSAVRFSEPRDYAP